MSNEDQIEELRKLVEQERIQKSEARKQRDKKWLENLTPEELVVYRQKRVKLSVAGVRKRKENKATRPKPPACEVCSKICEVVYDHNHTNKVFRGWLCKECNLALGYVNDDPLILEKLAVYLRTHNKE